MLPDSLREFLTTEKVCSLAVVIPDGGVHVAPLLFWCDTQDLKVYMSTSKRSEKMWWYPDHQNVSAGIAIGLTKGLPFSLQMRGVVEVFDPSTSANITEHYSRIASDLDDPSAPENIMIVFRPTWVRYTDRHDNYKTHRIFK